MKCRAGCGACCIAPSISSSIPGMPDGKPAGVPCIHLASDWQCDIYNSSDRPDVCKNFIGEPDICGASRKEALLIMADLEGISLYPEKSGK